MDKLSFAKQLRSNQTETEKLMWFHLRGKRFINIKFKRQQIIGKYIVDFVCFKYKLIIELDGGQHPEEINIQKDLIRTKFLQDQGFKVLRYLDNDVFNHIEDVLEDIFRNIAPSPLEDITYLQASPTSGRGNRINITFL